MQLRILGIFIGLLFIRGFTFGQSTSYHQFWNEFAFTKTMGPRWAVELNLGQAWTSTPAHKSLFDVNSQVYVRGWVHYYASPRWKLSLFLAYYYNKYVPDIDQREYPETRLALQGTYYFHRGRYTLSGRLRLEDRHILDQEGYFEGVYRFRTQVRCDYPINAKRIRKGTIYGIGCEEMGFKSPSSVAGLQVFDRNRFTIGSGYSLTDNIQVEITYVNEILPRSPNNEIYNALQVNANFNNFFTNLGKTLFTKKAETNPSGQ